MNDREHAAWQGFLTLHATLTEEIDRVERAGHVVRQECDADGRVFYAQLSEKGKAQLLEARPTYVASIKGHFVERFDVRVLRKLAAGWKPSRAT